jgi:lysophospholipase L1-like esterase
MTQKNPPALKYYFAPPAKPTKRTLDTDICIYGGNASGVVAALQASRMGKTAIVLEPSEHLGGLTAGGLGETDIGNKAAIGGLSHEFYRRIGQKYGMEEEWRFEPRVAEQVLREMLAEAKAPVYHRQFLSSVQKQNGKITSITTEAGLTVRAKMFIDCSYEGDLMAKSGVKYHVGRESNATYDETFNGVQIQKGHQFDRPVDPYVQEGNPASGLLPGINPSDPGPPGTGDKKIQAYNFRLCLTNDPNNRIPYQKPEGYDPQQYVLLGRYLKAGWPESEVFRKFDPIHNSSVLADTGGAALQTADLTDAGALITKFKRAEGPLTSYLKQRFTPALSAQIDAFVEGTNPSNMLKSSLIAELNGFAQKGALYSADLFSKVNLSTATQALVKQNLQGRELSSLNRSLLLEAYPKELGPKKYAKVDKNNHGAISTDYIGANYSYPEASYAERERIFQDHVRYQKGLMWFLGNDPSVPEKIRTRWSEWGLPKDDFVATGGWPHQLYVREARRMISDYVMTEHNCVGKTVAADPVGMAAYTMDSHNVQRFVKDGRVWNEGDVQVRGFPPYPISYRSIVPKKAECSNLFVPVCLAASHIAYGSIRMEPVFMLLGQSAASAASLAIDGKLAVQDVPYPQLRTILERDKQVLSWKLVPKAVAAQAAVSPTTLGTPVLLNNFFHRVRFGEPQTVVVYGTSLTAGGAWTGSLKQWFDQQFPGKVKFINSGLSGQNSDEGLKQVKEKVLVHNPDLVFIEFGINDAHVKFNMPVERGASNLDGIVKAIQNQNSKTAVVLQTMNPSWDAPNGNRSATDRPQLVGFYDNYRNYARNHNVLLIDNYSDWQKLKDSDPGKYQSFLGDGLHPSAAAYEAVTWPNLKAVLEKARDSE